ncbi:hypothetical protein NDU88_005859 [Pleurodeles waltl]|uniref:Uncharacterized protein n=1 Tax=Pleurodeles waltl TaxID=8319 RepID=A0AAV7RNF3_PLEWA|nr:hypothetical protein NDU88_005859 [Pleurodeles waltl]
MRVRPGRLRRAESAPQRRAAWPLDDREDRVDPGTGGEVECSDLCWCGGALLMHGGCGTPQLWDLEPA